MEEFINSAELLPNDIRRNSELMRELDKDSADTAKEIETAEVEVQFLTIVLHMVVILHISLQKAFVQNFDIKRVRDEDVEQLQDIRAKRLKSSMKNEEKVAIAEQTLDFLESFVRKLDNDLAVFEGNLRNSGDFETTGAPTGQEVAVRTDLFTDDWILARVVGYSLDTGYYEVADADESKRYHLPESQVVVMNIAASQKKLSKGESILAGECSGVAHTLKHTL